MKKNNEKKQMMTTENNNQKTKIYNLVILDKSGSMSSIAQGAIMGFNETLKGIRNAQEMYKDTQEHFVSLYVFCSCEKVYLYDKEPIANVQDLDRRRYYPCCGTPLYDAMGFSLKALQKDIQDMDDATAVVTIITDGCENASSEFSGNAIKALVEELTNKEGWMFSYIGANQDVKAVGASLSIQATMSFDYDSARMRKAFDKEMHAKMRGYERLSNQFDENQNLSIVEKKLNRSRMHQKSTWYLGEDDIQARVTPAHITQLQTDEIFVFGSNIHGHHTGGAARQAAQSFGAVEGQGVGLQGQSYAIPTVGVTDEEMREYIREFILFARQHPENKFLVTSVGCGIAGHSKAKMAHMFVAAQEVENISLPMVFWKELL